MIERSYKCCLQSWCRFTDSTCLDLNWQLVFPVDINKTALCCCCCDRETFPHFRPPVLSLPVSVENSITILLFGAQMENVDDGVIFYSQLRHKHKRRHAWWMNEWINEWVCLFECTHICHMRFPLRVFIACLQLIRIVMSPFNSIISTLLFAFSHLFV